MKYPWRPKRFYPVSWPAQAVIRERGRVILPMGRGRPSLVLPLELPEKSGACTQVWNHGFELHVRIETPQEEQPPGNVYATVDLGEIHLAATTTNRGAALIVTGRGIRSLKRQRHRHLGQIAKKQSRCQKYSRRWKKLQRARNKQCRRAERRIRDLRHKATRKVIDFCVKQHVGALFIGNSHGVRTHDNGRHHNQRMALWEYGKDIDYLTHKAKQAHISCFTGSERGTSSQCPCCGHIHKPKGRNWACRTCGFTGHRDLVGSVNMHKIAFGTQVMFPRSFTYLRPRSSRADTPQRCLESSPSIKHCSRSRSLRRQPTRWMLLRSPSAFTRRECHSSRARPETWRKSSSTMLREERAARHAAVEFASSVPRKDGKMVFCAQKVLVKTKNVMYTALQRPGIALSTGSKIVCLANAILKWPLKPIEAQRCVKRPGSRFTLSCLRTGGLPSDPIDV